MAARRHANIRASAACAARCWRPRRPRARRRSRPSATGAGGAGRRRPGPVRSTAGGRRNMRGKTWSLSVDADLLRVAELVRTGNDDAIAFLPSGHDRSEEHTYELQSLMRISYAVLCFHQKIKHNTT